MKDKIDLLKLGSGNMRKGSSSSGMVVVRPSNLKGKDLILYVGIDHHQRYAQLNATYCVVYILT